ncbi:MAG: SCO family protein [Rhodospirillaceae bacterium]|jgi:cytochrome oxidase Cu insertion factor (SCO1/SenC/PrrC family)|nr:SCO family protein [Rhodospirillaceae bacterium]MBT5564945.1 SCO family protein [Rhodospirillaceae bacterium]MBT6090513.1 SCO family protein [Rhodospirillaceae bacterium]
MTPALAKRLIIGGMVAIGTLLILALYLPGLRPNPNDNTVEGSAAIGGAFTLTDHTGATVTEQALLGHYSLIYFGFTYCPDICPMTLQTVADAIEILPGQKGESVQPIFITLDPKRDTVETMSAYVSNFHSSMIGLTGTQDQVQKAADAYRVFFREAPIGEDGDYTIDHSGFLYLMNRGGRYIDHFGKDVTMEDLSARLRELL